MKLLDTRWQRQSLQLDVPGCSYHFVLKKCVEVVSWGSCACKIDPGQYLQEMERGNVAESECGVTLVPLDLDSLPWLLALSLTIHVDGVWLFHSRLQCLHL